MQFSSQRQTVFGDWWLSLQDQGPDRLPYKESSFPHPLISTSSHAAARSRRPRKKGLEGRGPTRKCFSINAASSLRPQWPEQVRVDPSSARDVEMHVDTCGAVSVSSVSSGQPHFPTAVKAVRFARSTCCAKAARRKQRHGLSGQRRPRLRLHVRF